MSDCLFSLSFHVAHVVSKLPRQRLTLGYQLLSVCTIDPLSSNDVVVGIGEVDVLFSCVVVYRPRTLQVGNGNDGLGFITPVSHWYPVDGTRETLAVDQEARVVPVLCGFFKTFIL